MTARENDGFVMWIPIELTWESSFFFLPEVLKQTKDFLILND